MLMEDPIRLAGRRVTLDLRALRAGWIRRVASDARQLDGFAIGPQCVARPRNEGRRYVAHDVVEQLARLSLPRLPDGRENPRIEARSADLSQTRMPRPILDDALSLALYSVRRQPRAQHHPEQLDAAPIDMVVGIDERGKQQAAAKVDQLRMLTLQRAGGDNEAAAVHET
jgi:hypothetical protein